MPSTGPTRPALAIVGLLLAFGLPELIAMTNAGRGSLIPWPRELIWWSAAAIVLAWVLWVERRPLASIGLVRPTVRTFVVGVLVAIALFVSVVLFYAVVFPMLGLTMNERAVAGITQNPPWFLVLLALRAAVVEEIVYRGYPITRIEALTGSRWVAALVSIAVFTLAHVSYWGFAQLLIVVTGAIALTLLFLWRRDLVCNMVAHFLVDLAGILAASLQR